MLARAVLMVRPAAFGFSEQAAATNVFQRRADRSADAVRAAALSEFDGAVAALRAAGITVHVVEDTPDPPKPDAVFPNNWVSTHPDGTAVLYPMAVPSRRAERRAEIVAAIPGVRRVIDLSPLEGEGGFLEGTGSLVLDHDARLAFACSSPRTTRRGIAAFCAAMGFRPVIFRAAIGGADVYHTNVVLSLGPGRAILAWNAVVEGADALRDALAGRDVLAISEAQVRAYAGNALVLDTPSGPRTVISRAGLDALTRDEAARLCPPIALDIPTIERVGGGSARCMLAEVFGTQAT